MSENDKEEDDRPPPVVERQSALRHSSTDGCSLNQGHGTLFGFLDSSQIRHSRGLSIPRRV